MFREFRKRVYSYFIVKLLLIWGAMYLFFWIFAGDNFVHDAFVKMIAYPGKTIEINPGEDLAKYSKKKVRCTFKYVINPVKNFYEEGSDQVPYTCGYVVLDDKRENPFCVFVPLEKREQMEELMMKTWEIERGETENASMVPITVEGRVRYAGGEMRNRYMDALQYLYGEDYVQGDMDVYYIDDASSVAGTKHEEFAAIIVLGMFWVITCYCIIAYTIVRIIRLLCWQLQIRKFIKKNNVSKEELNREFALAKKVAPNFWVSPQYTFFVKDIEAYVVKNQEIGSSLMKPVLRFVPLYSVVLQTKEKQYKSGSFREVNATLILQHYAVNFPHIGFKKA